MTRPVFAAQDVTAELRSRLRRGQTVDQLISVGERTGWWTPDDVDWAAVGHDAPRPAGWTLDDGQTIDVGPVKVLRDGQWVDAVPSAADSGTDIAADSPTTEVPAQVAEPAAQPDEQPDSTPDRDKVTADPEPTPPTSYVHVVRVDEVFADPTYQRGLDEARVRRMAAEWNPRMVAVIDVSDRGPDAPAGRRYAVVNGQHRWAAAAAAGLEHLAATIHEGLDVAGEARLMYELDRGTKALNSWDRWKARRAAGDPAVLAIDAIADEHSMTASPASFGAVGAAERILRSDGRDLLTTVVRLLVAAWGPAHAATKAPLLTGLATVLRQHADAVDADRLVDALRRTSPQALRSRADMLRELQGGSLHALTAQAIVAAYNAVPGPKLVLR